MSEEKLDYEKWKTEYPFLKNIWDMYEQFDNAVDSSDRKKKIYEGMCKLYIASMGKKEEEYLDFCMKYLRNLDPYCIYLNTCKSNNERCNHLNYWLYDSIIKKKLDNKVISSFYDKTMTHVNNRYNNFMCYYYSYNEIFREPENILKLMNFQSNINIIEEILKDIDHRYYCFCEKYIYECVDIYKKMYNKYCSTFTLSDSDNTATCNQLLTFSNIYSTFLSSVQNFNDKIPTLDLKKNEFLIECSLEKRNPKHMSDKIDNPDSSTPLTVQTALGTAAGISSILAVLYKFTPFGRILRSTQQGTAIWNNLNKADANEILLDIPEHTNINSFNENYDIGYGSV